MSHLTKISSVEITDITCLKKAVKRLKGVFKENQKTFAWYSGRQGTCDHAISFPNATFEIGVIKDANKNKYEMQWDSYYTGGLPKHVGDNAGLLAQAYNIEVAKKAAMLQGYTVAEKAMNDGRILLKVAINE